MVMRYVCSLFTAFTPKDRRKEKKKETTVNASEGICVYIYKRPDTQGKNIKTKKINK